MLLDKVKHNILALSLSSMIIRTNKRQLLLQKNCDLLIFLNVTYFKSEVLKRPSLSFLREDFFVLMHATFKL